jgi:hypothetical protein
LREKKSQVRSEDTLNRTINEKTSISGSMLTLRYLLKVLIERRVSDVTISCVPTREASSTVANAPKLAPVAVKVTIVVTVVVVTVDIMADNQALFRCQDAYKVY